MGSKCVRTQWNTLRDSTNGGWFASENQSHKKIVQKSSLTAFSKRMYSFAAADVLWGKLSDASEKWFAQYVVC